MSCFFLHRTLWWLKLSWAALPGKKQQLLLGSREIFPLKVSTKKKSYTLLTFATENVRTCRRKTRPGQDRKLTLLSFGYRAWYVSDLVRQKKWLLLPAGSFSYNEAGTWNYIWLILVTCQTDTLLPVFHHLSKSWWIVFHPVYRSWVFTCVRSL